MDQELYELLADEIKACETTPGHCFIVRQEYKDYINSLLDDIKVNFKYRNLSISSLNNISVETLIEVLNEVSIEFLKRIKLEEHEEIYFDNRSFTVFESILSNYKDNDNYKAVKKRIFNIYVIYRYLYIGLVQEKDKELKKAFKEKKIKEKDALNINWITQNQNELAEVLNNLNGETGNKKKDSKATKQKKLILEAISYPIDKLNSLVWNNLSNNFYDGTIEVGRYIEISHNCKDMYVLFKVDFSNLKNVQLSDNKLTPYEKRVYFAISNLFNNYPNIPYLTLDNVGRIIYNSKKMSQMQRTKLYEAVIKLSKIKISIDNEEAVKRGYDMHKYKYYGDLLPVDVLDVEEKKIIGIFRKTAMAYKVSPLFDYMLAINQYITVKSEAIQIPLTINDKNIALSDYLLKNIKMNSNNKNYSISFKKIYENTGLTEDNYRKLNKPKNLKRDQKLMLNDIQELLNYWLTKNIFKRFSLDEKNINIYYK